MKSAVVFGATILASVLGLLGAYGHWRTPSDERIDHPVAGVSEITLQYDPFNAGTVRGPVMGLGYARWINFSRILYKGESFYQVGSGSTRILPDARPTRYIVREGYRVKSGVFGSVRYATLAVEDSDAKVITAEKEWRCDTSECRYLKDGEQGWPGQHAALFVRRALNPDMAVGGNVGIKPYPRTVATFTRENPKTLLTRETITAHSFDCPEDLKVYVREDINQMVVARPNWTYVPANMTRQVRCTADGLFVFSTTFPNDIFVDWLSPTGELLGQYHVETHVQFPSSGGGTFPFLAAAKLMSGTLELRMAYFHEHWPVKGGDPVLPEWEYLAKISREASAQRHAP